MDMSRNTVFSILSCLSLLVLSACEQKPEAPQQVEVLSTSEPSTVETPSAEAVAQVAPAAPAPQPSTSRQLEPGQYVLQLGQGLVTLRASEASRQTILADMAGQIGFELRNPQGLDALVSVEVEDGSIYQLLDGLMDGVAYSPRFGDRLRDNGFRLTGITVGEGSALLEAVGAEETASEPSIALAASGIPMPPAKGEIYFGSEPDEVELAQRLQFGPAEERAIAVSELMMDPTGFNAAYLTFLRDPDPEVRLAVLELIEAEENFVAKQMIVASLSDTSRDIVMYALEIVDSLGDFSLVPQVEALFNHYDPEVREYAREVRESLTAGYFEPDEY